MKMTEFPHYIFLLICHIASAKLINLEGLEKTFDLFENRCFVNILFVGFTANFVLHDTPIQHTTITGTLRLDRYLSEQFNPRNASLWPSWRIKRFECVLNTIAISPYISSQFTRLSSLIRDYFERSFDPPHDLDMFDGKFFKYRCWHSECKLKSPNYFLFIRDKPHTLDSRLVLFIYFIKICDCVIFSV